MDFYLLLEITTYVGKDISNTYSQKLADSAKKSATDATKTASKSAIQKTAETTGDLIGNKIADKIKSTSKKSSKELHDKELPSNENQKKDIYLHKKDNKSLIN